MNDQPIRDRMLSRITAMENHLNHDLTDALSTLESTRWLRTQLHDQAQDADRWVSLIEDRSPEDEDLADALWEYQQSLEAAIDPHAPAPHFHAVRQGLEKKLEPEQYETVLADPRVRLTQHASLENALYSGKQTLMSSAELSEQDQNPEIYRDHKYQWNQQAAMAVLDGEPIEISPGLPVQSAVNDVLTEDQRITQDQRKIDSAMLAGQPQLAANLGVGTIERTAMEIYGTPMIDDGPMASSTSNPPQPEHAPSLQRHQQLGHVIDLG